MQWATVRRATVPIKYDDKFDNNGLISCNKVNNWNIASITLACRILYTVHPLFFLFFFII